MSYTAKWHSEGPDKRVLEDGGELVLKSGSTLTVEEGADVGDLKGDKGDPGDPGAKGDPGNDGADGLWAEVLSVVPKESGAVTINELLEALAAEGLIEVDNTTAEAQLALILDEDLDTVPFGTANNKGAIETELLIIANGALDEGWSATIEDGSTYDDVTGDWEGAFRVSNDETPLNTAFDAPAREITVTIATE